MSYPASQDIFPDLNGTHDVESAHQNNRGNGIENTQGFIGVSGKAQSYSSTILSMLLDNYIGGRCYKKDNDEIYIGAFAGIINNAADTERLLRVKKTVTTLSVSDLDTGSFAADTFYYIYATADSAGTEPVFVISASASTPSGYTHYRKIGWFYNETAGVLDITKGFVGNIKDGSDNPNIVRALGTSDISTSSTTYVDMTDMEIKFVSNGRPVKISFTAPITCANGASSRKVSVTLDIDGADKIVTGVGIPSGNQPKAAVLNWLEDLSAGTHTIKIQWKITSDTAEQKGSLHGARIFICEEL